MDTVLLIDDDAEIFNLVKSYARDSFALHYGPSLKASLEYLDSNRPDLIVLDIELGDGNGIEFFVKNRARLEEQDISVLMLSGNTQLQKKLESFELGALDYINKPFEPMELMARIKGILKRKQKTATVFTKKDITVELQSNKVTVEHEGKKSRLDLSPLEYKLLILMMKQEDRVFSREQLMDLVWGPELNVTDRTVDQHISKLRKKLTSHFYHIKTEHRMGYSFSLISDSTLKTKA